MIVQRLKHIAKQKGRKTCEMEKEIVKDLWIYIRGDLIDN